MFSGAASAVDYRGFVEFNGGLLPVDEYDGYDSSSELYCHLYGSLSTTHGVQLNRHIFVGAGVDVNITGFRSEGDPQINVFGDVRYDVDIVKKWSPYVNMKVGYGVRKGTAETSYGYYAESIKQLFINPSIGVRLRLSSKCGLNFGFGYVPISMGKIYNYSGNIVDDSDTGRDKVKGAFTLNVGIDF